jgi:ribonuclease HII
MFDPAADTLNAPTGYEMGVDEAGRGPLFGRVYAAAVVLPLDPAAFDHSRMRDSKKIKSRTKMRDLAAYIRANAVACAVAHVEHTQIDATNILAANMVAMHEAMRAALAGIDGKVLALVDGNYFKPLMVFDDATGMLREVPARTVVGGDGKHSVIAAASILARAARDEYIDALVLQYPELETRYGIARNQGYGTAEHMAGIAAHGISQFHRRTFRPCNVAALSPVESHIV